MTNLEKEKRELHERLKKLAPAITLDEVTKLRRSALTLHAWYEEECNGTIQRDEEDGKPYRYSSVTGQRIGGDNPLR